MPEARLERTRRLNNEDTLAAIRLMREIHPACRHQIAISEEHGTSCMNCGWPVSAAGRDVVRLAMTSHPKKGR